MPKPPVPAYLADAPSGAGNGFYLFLLFLLLVIVFAKYYKS